jgi:hypothetical protein
VTAAKVGKLELVHRPVASRPEARIVEVELAGDFAGWWARARADFPADRLAMLQSDSIALVLEVLEEIIVEHNMPNAAGELAESCADVDPYDGLLAIVGAIIESIGSLPNRSGRP